MHDKSSKGADIKIYIQEKNDFGYIYWLFENLDNEAKYWQSIEFNTFEDICLISPYKGKKFELMVEPQTYEIVLMKAGSKAQIQIDQEHQDHAVILGDEGLKLLLKEKNMIEYNGIKKYEAWHDNGFAVLYFNDTKTKTFNEKQTYNLQGLTLQETG